MSEYQYYEFRAVDRPLSDADQRRLRQLSSRAEITRVSFTNEYSFGDFKGRTEDLMETMFDAHVYVANWGTHKFMLRLPASALSQDEAEPYLPSRQCDVWTESGATILSFVAEEEGGGYEEGCGDWMSSLLPLRDDLIHGDRRCLYVTWLMAVQEGDVENDAVEPPVPPGLRDLSASLSAFTEFLRIDPDLLAAAAAGSDAKPGDDPSSWVGQLDATDKDRYLVRLLQGETEPVRRELRKRFDKEAAICSGRRTVGDLLQAAESERATRQRLAAEERAIAKARQQAQEAALKAHRLKALALEGTQVWIRLESLIQKQTAREYETVVDTLRDLRDLAAEQRISTAFEQRLTDLRARHSRRQGLMKRLNQAGLVASGLVNAGVQS